MNTPGATANLAMLLCGVLFLPVTESAYAAVTDPAAIQVQTLTVSLLKSMRAGPALSITERYRELEPVIAQVFALPLMTRISVGPDWANLSPEQQKAVIAAFSRYTIANYVHNFRDFDGQKFEIDDKVVSRGEWKIVQTRLISPHDTNLLVYRMLEVDGNWKIVDVSYNGVSELTLHRSDYPEVIASGGAPALIAQLNKASDDLMK